MLYSAGQQPLLRKISKDMKDQNGGIVRAFIDDISLQGTVIVLVSKCKQTFRYKIELQKGFQRLEQVLEGNICMDKNSPSYILLEEDPPKFSESVAEIWAAIEILTYLRIIESVGKISLAISNENFIHSRYSKFN